MTKILNSQSSPFTERASISFKTLKGTLLQHKADQNKERQSEDEVDLNACIAKIKPDVKHGSAIMRSSRLRKAFNFLPENSVKQRKAYYCAPESGYFVQKVEFNQMASMLQNPDMMGNMVKQNIQSVINVSMFRAIGAIFSGFIIAQLPYPLGQKFKTMTQQGIRLHNLDPSFVSSMSWSFLLIYGLSGILSLMITDTKALEETLMAQSGNMMMQNQNMMGGGKDFNQVFKVEKENYEILNWKFALEDIDDAFIAKY
eukprot:CAMPEP_0168615702 /NCGR_PEP_ID=MMETSP0449_2-20121227/4641_1 /TAXON_ID=1082188 /ORGANISM="Strombidium rassoulzadegani, Strain ras09" /LENGTH=256 /DNA_ID=CAMNT_0008656451 /DNA_START=107 /DNA_END=874 /DNA_ORIENTATION=-